MKKTGITLTTDAKRGVTVISITDNKKDEFSMQEIILTT